MTIWLVINSFATLVVGLGLYLTVRQVGYILSYANLSGARRSAFGPRVGENVTFHLDWLSRNLPAGPASSRPAVYIFGADSCPVCRSIRAASKELSKHWRDRASIYVVYDAEEGAEPQFATTHSNLAFWYSPGGRERLDIRSVPYGVCVDPDGVVLGHGVVNGISHVESLLELLLSPSEHRGSHRPTEQSEPSEVLTA